MSLRLVTIRDNIGKVMDLNSGTDFTLGYTLKYIFIECLRTEDSEANLFASTLNDGAILGEFSIREIKYKTTEYGTLNVWLKLINEG